MADEPTTEVVQDEGAEIAQPTEEQTTEAEVRAEPTSEDDGRSEPAKEEMSEEELTEWARKKGLPLSEQPTENELKLARMQREADRKVSQSTQRSSALEDAYKTQVDNLVSENPSINAGDARLAKLELELQVDRFFRNNPDASALESEMAQLVLDNPARANLPLEDLYEIAKSRSTNVDDLKKEGGKQALERLAAKQQAASPRAAATATVETSSGITREDVQKALANHDMDWLRRHEREIDALN